MYKIFQDAVYEALWHDFAYWPGWDFIRSHALIWGIGIILLYVIIRDRKICRDCSRDEELKKVGNK